MIDEDCKDRASLLNFRNLVVGFSVPIANVKTIPTPEKAKPALWEELLPDKHREEGGKSSFAKAR